MSKEYRTVPAQEVLGRLSPERRARVNARTLELLTEESGLADLRGLKGLISRLRLWCQTRRV